MSAGLILRRAGPGLTVQDAGRPGLLSRGLSRGGAADPLALAEGAALLGQDPGLAALEMAGQGGAFEATADLRIALTGAPMRATLDGRRLAWNASHRMPAGALLEIGGATAGLYGYLHLGGGIDTPELLGARATHAAAGLGAPPGPGDSLPAGADPGGPVDRVLEVADRFSGGTLRVVEAAQTDLFGPAQRAALEGQAFTRDPRSNRMAVRLVPETGGLALEAGLSVVSEVVVPGDIQVTGDGTPVVLGVEGQTVGGYPRIATVIPADLPRLAQCPPGASLRFRFVPLTEALAAEAACRDARAALPGRIRPLLRDPRDIPDLLSYQLVGGVVSATDPEPEG